MTTSKMKYRRKGPKVKFSTTRNLAAAMLIAAKKEDPKEEWILMIGI